LCIDNGNPQPIGQQVIIEVAQGRLVEYLIDYLNWLCGCFFNKAGRFGKAVWLVVFYFNLR
jgi:hypothetical protein